MCGKEMDSDAKFCPSCGEPVEQDEFFSDSSQKEKNQKTIV
jgi:rRNA maturation endonuclease Nob1